MKGHKMRRKKSVNFADQPEILQTPPKTAQSNKGEGLKSVLKKKPDLRINPDPVNTNLNNSDPNLEGSKTERFKEPSPLLPPFKNNAFKDTLQLNSKKPVKTINILENFNSSINKAKSNAIGPAEAKPLKLPSIVQKRYSDNANIQRIYIGNGNTINNALGDTRGV